LLEKHEVKELEIWKEETRLRMERRIFSQNDLKEEQDDFCRYQKVLKEEEEDCHLKSRSLWLKVWDRNTKLFQKEKARIWKNKINELKDEEVMIISG
jgi:hypothetical protein